MQDMDNLPILQIFGFDSFIPNTVANIDKIRATVLCGTDLLRIIHCYAKRRIDHLWR